MRRGWWGAVRWAEGGWGGSTARRGVAGGGVTARVFGSTRQRDSVFTTTTFGKKGSRVEQATGPAEIEQSAGWGINTVK